MNIPFRLMYKIALLLSIVLVFSCNPKEEPAPVPTYFCPISSETGVNDAYKLEYTYNNAGLIEGLRVSLKDNTSGQLQFASNAQYTYANNRLVKIIDGAVEETLTYTSDGALRSLVVDKTVEPAYINYTLTFETDANKRISKITDTKGLQTTIKRDAQGNIIETITTNTATNQEVYRNVLSDFDNKKTVQDGFEGWPFSILTYYGDYIKVPLFVAGAGGNYTKRVEYVAGKATRETTYTYTYNEQDFPLTEQSLTRFLDGSGIATYSKTYTYNSCK